MENEQTKTKSKAPNMTLNERHIAVPDSEIWSRYGAKTCAAALSTASPCFSSELK